MGTAYQYNIRYKSGKTLNNALSRLPRLVTSSDDGVPAELVHLILHLSSTSINIKDWTAKDPVFSRVLRYLQTGLLNQTLEEDFKPFVSRKSELSVLDGCILWGSRIVIPPQGRKLALEELHEAHPGCTKMKGLARNYIWWPKMDAAIEDTVKQCRTCQESRPSPPVAHFIPGNGRPSLGVAFIWTLQVHFLDPQLYSWMPTPNGWIFIPCNRLLLLK